MVMLSRCCRADVGELPFKIYPLSVPLGPIVVDYCRPTILEALQALECDFKIVGVGEFGRVVEDLDTQ